MCTEVGKRTSQGASYGYPWSLYYRHVYLDLFGTLDTRGLSPLRPFGAWALQPYHLDRFLDCLRFFVFLRDSHTSLPARTRYPRHKDCASFHLRPEKDGAAGPCLPVKYVMRRAMEFFAQVRTSWKTRRVLKYPPG